MRSVIRDFQERKSEIEDFYGLLDDIIEKNARLLFSDGSKKNLSVDISATLKSAGVLLLYNLVESTISNSVKEIHERFSNENLKFEQLNDKIQTLILAHYYAIMKKEENINEDNKLIELKLMLSIFGQGNPVKLTFRDYTKYKTGSQFSGNLDAREIRSVVGRYGITFLEKSNELKAIKEMRNKLAHGELSFQEACNNYTIQYMTVLRDKTFEFLESVIQSVKEFLDDGKYKYANT